MTKLIEKQRALYNKKFAFEKGLFNQSIPNPDPEKRGEMITVQLVKRVLQRRNKDKRKPSTE